LQKILKERGKPLPMNLQKITEEIFLVEGRNNGRFPFSHSLLIKDEKSALIDTGCGLDILSELKEKENIDFIINSHSHADHSCGNWLFDVPIYVPAEEFSFSGNIETLSKRYAGEGFEEKWQALVSGIMGFRNKKPTHSYFDGFLFDFGETKLEAIHTPGHTLGHYCFFEREEKILFSFDIDLTGFGPWYGHEESDIVDFKKSIERVSRLSPRLVVSSHRGMIKEDISSEFDKFLAKFDERENHILSLLEKEETIEELVDMAPIYRQHAFEGIPLGYWEKKMIEKHLTSLLEKGKIRKVGNGFRRI